MHACDPVGVNMAGGLASGALGHVGANQASEAATELVEQALYLFPLFPFMAASNQVRSGESRTIRLSTADSRGARYAEFL